MSVFSRTVGLRGEDTSTEVLSYLLTPRNPFVPFQKLFFLKVCGTAMSSEDLSAELVTQQHFGECIPDLLILTEDTLILLENKLGSPLSGDSQLVRYIDILRKHEELKKAFPTYEADRIKRRILVFLAPGGSIIASIRATENYSLRKRNSNFERLCTNAEVAFLAMKWEDLVAELDDSNALQRELRLYVQDNIGQEMTVKEKNVLSDTTVPVALEKLFKRLGKIRDAMSVDEFTPGRMGQSYNYFGFSIEHECVSLWFGYSLPTWAKRGAPVVLQIREKWVKAKMDEIKAAIKEDGYLKDEDLEWVLPFEIADIEGWDHRLGDALTHIAKVLRDAAAPKE
jgi:hypothetical protein